MEVLRAYSRFELKTLSEKAADGKPRRFTGVATTPTIDRMGDIVVSTGAQFTLPVPLLWQHDGRAPIGWITRATVSEEGISVEGEVADLSGEKDAPQSLKDRLSEAWASMKSGLVRGLSIGFAPKEYEPIKGSYGVKFTKWDWMELSAVTIPANAEASITAIKAADQGLTRAASGAKGEVRKSVRLNDKPGDSGSLFHHVSKEGHQMKITEQLAAFDVRRKTAIEQMDAIMAKAGDEGRSLEVAEQTQYDDLAAEVKTIGDHIVRLQAHEKLMLEKAQPVTPEQGRGEGFATIGSGPISVHRNLPKGTSFTRYVMALASAKGNLIQAERIAERWKDTPEVGLVIRAAADAGTTSDATWAGPLVQYQDMVGEFIDLLRNETIIGRMSPRRVPFNVRIPRQTSGSTGAFVGEGSPVPVRELAFDNVTMPWAKASSIVVVTAELARLSSPSAEALVRADLIAGCAEFLDKRLVDPAYPGVANVSPASLTNGVTPRAASGITLAAIDADVAYLFTQYKSNNIPLTNAVWLMSPTTAITLSMFRTNQDTLAFPGLTVNGGTFYNLPVIISNSVAGSGSPGDEYLILVAQNEVFLADDGQMTIDASSEASLEMNDAPSGGATSLVSLWQNGLMGVKVDRWIYWTKRRSAAVQFIDAAQRYGS